MYRSYTAWLVTVALALIGFGLDVKSATAQQLYTFNATYDVFSTSKPITPDVSVTTISGRSILGDRARYVGWRKNLFDLRRVAVVHNLHVIARMQNIIANQQAC